MYELIRAVGRSYYIDCPSRIGLVRVGDRDAVLIDSGSDRSAAKKVLRHLEAEGLSLRAILNTHSHGDHIGGNRTIAERTGCAVYAPDGEELAFVRHPILEPSYLFGAYPPAPLRDKFFVAEASDAAPLTESALPPGTEAIPLPGHSFAMLGFRTEDGAVYLADALASRETLDKYGIAVLRDVAAYLDTLHRIKELEGRIFIPSHAPVTENIAPLAAYNIERTEEVVSRILALTAASPLTPEELLYALLAAYGVSLTLGQYALVGSTVRSYVAYLLDRGELCAECSSGRLLLRRS